MHLYIYASIYLCICASASSSGGAGGGDGAEAGLERQRIQACLLFFSALSGFILMIKNADRELPLLIENYSVIAGVDKCCININTKQQGCKGARCSAFLVL